MALRRILRGLLAVTAAVAALVLTTRAVLGPFRLGAISVGSPMNAGSILGAALVLLALSVGAGKPAVVAHAEAGIRRQAWWADVFALTNLVLWVALAFLPSVSVGFVADDYAHILAARKADLATVAHWFTVPASDNLFFRPMAMVTYWLDAKWAGVSVTAWHASEVLWHLVNVVLLYGLARRVGLAAGWAFAAGLLFGVHGTRPEAVTWVGARFDLLATLGVLAALHAFLRFRDAGGRAALLALLTFGAFGMLAKESAFVLPVLMALAAWHLGRSKRDVVAIGAVTALAAGLFAYRWTVIGGIGGYVNASGEATVGEFNPALTLKALALRIWAVLFVPLNWTTEPGLELELALLVMAMAAVWMCWRAGRSNVAMFGLAFALVAAVPVYHLLLIGPDLEKSRVVYLASVGFAIFVAGIASAMPRPLGAFGMAAILAFQVSALRHNVGIFDRMAKVHLAACDTMGRAAKNARPQGLVAIGMPNTRNGIYLLATGLPECVEMRHGVPAGQVHLVDDIFEASKFLELPMYEWDSRTARVRGIESRVIR